jgi:penicillin-binding protein 1A
MPVFLRFLRWALYLGLAGVLLGGIALGTAYWLIAPRLPSVEALKDVRMQVPLRVKSADGRLIAMFGETKRTPVRIDEVPPQLRQAFLAAEDADFYAHGGIDLGGIARAVWLTVTTGSKHVAGGSTITQQVARMFFLSPEVSYTRKLSEIFLAFRIENALSKDEILQLYLNKAFFGHRSYGVAAAAEFYYGKTLDQLTLAECAMLASIPKFPSTGNPLSRPQRALERRGYVLGRMLENRFIERADYDRAMAAADLAQPHEPPVEVDAPYFAELVRREAIDRLGNEALTDGYVITTTLDATMQEAANRAVRDGLLAYDRRHGWRGAEGHVDLPEDAGDEALNAALADYRTIAGLAPAIVLESGARDATLRLADGQGATVELGSIAWARRFISSDRRGAAPAKVADVLKRGDIVRLVRDAEGDWQLAQIPAAEGALVAVDPADGAIRSMVGGFSFQRSKFNRSTQAARQPGSAFKPFLYSAAFERGFTPASVLNDAPVQFPDPSRPDGMWAPKNDDGSFQGPIRLREALVKSVNLVSVRLLDAIGVRFAREYMTRFGFGLDQVPENLSMALGTASVSPLAMARGYAAFANGGYLVDPYLITTIDDRDGAPVYHAEPGTACASCAGPEADTVSAAPANPLNPIASAHASGAPQTRLAPRALDPRNAYLVTSLMRDVVKRGTGSAAMSLKRNDLAGKTGSTNDHRDAWFAGFNPALAVSCWVGLDDFGSLGRGEFGAKAALPIWIDFMRVALEGVPEQPFDMPEGIARVRVDRYSGLLAGAGDPDAILEVMKSEDATRLASQPPPDEDANHERREAYDVF